MESNRQPATVAAAAVSKVLYDDDLLIEILLRVGFPTTLGCAALVCKRWLGHVSDRAFLRRFRKLHPPHLLGFYIEEQALEPTSPAFIPMLPQASELVAVVRCQRFSLEAYNFRPLYIDECRNGSVFVHCYDSQRNALARVHSPLSPQRGPTILPSLPRVPRGNRCTIMRQVLSQEDGNGLSYFCLHVGSTLNAQKPEFCVDVHMLQDGFWHETHHILNMGQLPHPRSEPKSVLIDNKIYMPTGPSEITVLDLMSSSLSKIQLTVLDLMSSSLSKIQFPEGVEHHRRGTIMFSRAEEASGLYLIQAKEFQLYIWLHKGDNWMLVDTICLREMCDSLKKKGCTIEDYHTPFLMSQGMDYGDFLFFKMGGCVLYLDIKCRTLRKVYETKPCHVGGIHPFMMIWPPRFPKLKYDPSRFFGL